MAITTNNGHNPQLIQQERTLELAPLLYRYFRQTGATTIANSVCRISWDDVQKTLTIVNQETGEFILAASFKGQICQPFPFPLPENKASLSLALLGQLKQNIRDFLDENS